MTLSILTTQKRQDSVTAMSCGENAVDLVAFKHRVTLKVVFKVDLATFKVYIAPLGCFVTDLWAAWVDRNLWDWISNTETEVWLKCNGWRKSKKKISSSWQRYWCLVEKMISSAEKGLLTPSLTQQSLKKGARKHFQILNCKHGILKCWAYSHLFKSGVVLTTFANFRGLAARFGQIATTSTHSTLCRGKKRHTFLGPGCSQSRIPPALGASIHSCVWLHRHFAEIWKEQMCIWTVGKYQPHSTKALYTAKLHSSVLSNVLRPKTAELVKLPSATNSCRSPSTGQRHDSRWWGGRWRQWWWLAKLTLRLM